MAESVLRNTPCAQPGLGSSAENLALETVCIWGLPLARLDREQTVDMVDRLIKRGRPSFFITANLQYAMLSAQDSRLAGVNRKAVFLVADGMPMVWYSRFVGCSESTGRPLPERVAGSDLIYMLCCRAAERGHRVFFLGGKPGVAADAATTLTWMYPGLTIVGIEAPELESLSAEERHRLIERIRDARPDLLLVAFGQPKGELWIAENLEALGIPACVQVGASFDFVAGRAARAPRWMQRSGLEWLYRMACDPRRLGPRYAKNAWFLAKALMSDATARVFVRQTT
jgi:N-acetylglucosaminyldiphosphoundecaprenol N-acetyl-beta-D-mannosaminyltransferase